MVVVTCELLVTKGVQRFPPRIIAIIGISVVSVGIMLYSAPWGIAGLVVATLVWTVGEMVVGPTLASYPARVARPEMRGRYLGMANAAFGLGAALGPAAGIAAWTVVGDRVWILAGFIGLLAGLAAAIGIRPVASDGEEQ